MRAKTEEKQQHIIQTRPHNAELTQGWRAGALVPMTPTKRDREVAEIIICTHMGLISRLEVLERAGRVILVDVDIILETRSSQLTDDPVVPLVTKKTGFVFNFAFRRFVEQVAWFNWMQRKSIKFSYRQWYRKTRFWAWLVNRTVPLHGGEWEYFVYHIMKTLNNPTRRN